MSTAQQTTAVDEVWSNLFAGIEDLFQLQTLRYSKWMQLYTYIFDHCTHGKHSDIAELYENFRNYLRNYLENAFESAVHLYESDLPEFYLSQWNKYHVSCKILHGICSYLHRHYVPRQQNLGHSDICEIYPMAMKIWQQMACRMFYDQITPICLRMIEAERRHQNIDSKVIRNFIETYFCCDIHKSNFTLDNTEQMLDIYRQYFEDSFLKDTQKFYHLEATTYLQQHSVVEYLFKISKYIDEEIQRGTVYLHPSTIEKLTKELEKILILDQLEIIHVEAKILIRNENTQDLNVLFQKVIRVENGKVELKIMLANHIHQSAIETIERINPITNNDLSVYIHTIFDLHQKYLTFIQTAFDNDAEFTDVLDQTCREFVNRNAVVRTIGNPTRMAECLASYCDEVLRKGEKQEIDIDKTINQIKILLYYMQEKDVFGKFYSKHLAKRLVRQLNISIEYEKLMVATIQDACGYSYELHIKQMCQDIETSVDILRKYDQYCQTEQIYCKIRFSILVLKSNAWSFSKPPDIILPEALQFIINNFTKFYNHLYNERKLSWLHQHAKSDLQYNHTNKSYRLQISMYQLIVLLLFNDSLEYTLERIHDQTQIRVDLLQQILNTLLKSKILTCTRFTDQEDLEMNSVIKLSNDFTNEKHRINLNIPIKAIRSDDVETTHNKIDHDRRIVIQVTIVQIMKSHKTMNQTVLIKKVIQKLTSRFNPNISVMKNCIETLIEKEYLTRQSDNTDVLEYIA